MLPGDAAVGSLHRLSQRLRLEQRVGRDLARRSESDRAAEPGRRPVSSDSAARRGLRSAAARRLHAVTSPRMRSSLRSSIQTSARIATSRSKSRAVATWSVPTTGSSLRAGKHSAAFRRWSRSPRKRSSSNRWPRCSTPATSSARRPHSLHPAWRSRSSALSSIPSRSPGLDVPEPEIQAGKIRCEVVEFNRFGNVKLNVREAHLVAAGIDGNPDLAVEAVSGSTRARRGDTYADFAAGEYGVIFDPRGWLMVVRGNPASALEGLGLATGDPVWLSGPTSRSRARFALVRRDVRASASGRTQRMRPQPFQPDSP